MKVMSLNGGSSSRFKKTCAAIGIFDGVHRGHRYLIKRMLASAHRLGAKPIVITFFPHPAHVLRPDVKLGYLTSLQDRYQLLGDLGVAACVVVPFDPAFARIAPEEFIKDVLVRQLGVKAVFVGADFRFGKKRAGDISLLKELGEEYGYETHALKGVKQGGDVISSTRIRHLVSTGNLKAAAALLDRPFFVSGTVIEGSRRGKGLGFATANVDLSCRGGGVFVLPPSGVYIVQAVLKRKPYPAIANLGTRPSFDNTPGNLHLEVHVLDFKKNIYGQHLKVNFLKKIRDEKKFPALQALVGQIRKDEAFARKYFFKKKPVNF